MSTAAVEKASVIILVGLSLLGRVHGQQAIDTCTAVKKAPHSSADVRGTAELGGDGLILADYTCPVITSKAGRVASMLLAEVQSFSSESLRRQFEAVRQQDLKTRPLLQVIVRGSIECNAGIRFVFSDDGEDIVGGTGYGPSGLAKCRMQKAKLVFLQELRAVSVESENERRSRTRKD